MQLIVKAERMNHKLLNQLSGNGMPQHLAFAVARNEMSEVEAWAEHAKSIRAGEIIALRNSSWPRPIMRWDASPKNFHHALDGCKQAEFIESYPHVELIGVEVTDLNANLIDISLRKEGPFSELYRSKSAHLVAHIESGGLVTPPLVRFTKQGLYIEGGNHRFDWARHIGQRAIPILVSSDELDEIRAVLSNTFTWRPGKT